jgi:hypothetical protein
MSTNLRPALRLWRDLFEAVAGDVAPIDVRAHVPPGSVAGHRLARWFGFEMAGEREIPPLGRFTVWRREF